MVEYLLPGAAQDARMKAAESAIARINALQYPPVYDFDRVTATALFDLAQQFNVMGLRGFALADTEAKKRTLLKNAIALHRTAGTPYSVLLALESVGYPNSAIEENPGVRYDGSFFYSGVEAYRGESWGFFIVTIDESLPAPTVARIQLILALIEEWKNLRSVLLDLRQGGRSLLKNAFLYDGAESYDGNQTYDGSVEEL